MEVILTKKVEKVGRIGDVKTVKDGYYRNFLHPKGLAIVATPARLKWAEQKRNKAVKEQAEIAEKALEFKKQLEEMTLTIEIKTTDKDTLYGSITEKELVKEFEKVAKLKLKKKQIELAEPIKTVGKHKVTVKLADDVVAEVKIEVKAK
jgi:large subunit ribosomal protein L9